MNTYLTGGLILFTILISLIKFEVSIDLIKTSEYSKVNITLISSFILAVLSTPIGYIINQIWMVIFHQLFDIHNKIYPLPEYINIETLKHKFGKSCWKKSYLNEVLLALHHRKCTPTDSTEFLSWHRNRLNDLHSNGTNAFSLIIGLICCFVISSYINNSTWIITSLYNYLTMRWWFVLLIIFIIFINIMRTKRIYNMLIIYNQISLLNICKKCSIICDNHQEDS